MKKFLYILLTLAMLPVSAADRHHADGQPETIYLWLY